MELKENHHHLIHQELIHIYKIKVIKINFFYIMVILLDPNSLTDLINKIKPDEIYNFAAQSHVGVSFQITKLYHTS